MDETRPLTLRYTPTARSDFASLLAYVGSQSPQGRHSLEAQLRAEIELLRTFPLAGAATTRAGLRRRIVSNYPYVIFYRIEPQTLVIVAARHSSRKPRLP